MSHWQEIASIIKKQKVKIEKIYLTESQLRIEGDFELPPLAQLSYDDQIFVAAFVKTHGSIKEMEKLFGVSYPTIKSRLNQLSEKLGQLGINIETTPKESDQKEILDLLDRGEITAQEALERLKK